MEGVALAAPLVGSQRRVVARTAPLVGAQMEGVALAAPLVGCGGRSRAKTLLLCLSLTAALARGCLHCEVSFSEKFSFYRHHVNLKSWWVGDIPVSGTLLADWSQDTMKELHLAIPAEITREKLLQVASIVYQKLDQLYQGKMYYPGYFPNELRAIFREQVRLLQNAIIESRISCQRHCGIFRYETISCTNCTDSHVICFGYNCEYGSAYLCLNKGPGILTCRRHSGNQLCEAF